MGLSSACAGWLRTIRQGSPTSDRASPVCGLRGLAAVRWQWKVGAGKLLVCMSDLEKAAKYPEGKAFYQSIIDYMRSADFNPSAEITVDELKKKLAEKPRQVSLKELNNISQY